MINVRVFLRIILHYQLKCGLQTDVISTHLIFTYKMSMYMELNIVCVLRTKSFRDIVARAVLHIHLKTTFIILGVQMRSYCHLCLTERNHIQIPQFKASIVNQSEIWS